MNKLMLISLLVGVTLSNVCNATPPQVQDQVKAIAGSWQGNLAITAENRLK